MEPKESKILLVDDDPKQRESLAEVVDSFGYKVFPASSVQEAFSLCHSQTQAFDLVILDYMIDTGNKTGFDYLAEFRQRLGDAIPILMMTGYADMAVVVRALRQGLSDFLIKPIEPEYLRRTMERNLMRAHLLKENDRLLIALRARHEELEKLSEFKSKFLSFCAHDLANTVSSCSMAGDLLWIHLKKEATDQMNRHMGLFKESLAQTQRLIWDLADLSAIANGKFRINKISFKVSDFSQAPLFAMIREHARIKGAGFDLALEAEPGVEIIADHKRILQVLTNLLDNALRYTPAGAAARCRISFDRKSRVVLFRVEDQGPGINKEDIPHLFESFYQSQDPKKQRGRLGLGLTIAKEIVEGHGGKIWVESVENHKGAAFSFTIPLGS